MKEVVKMEFATLITVAKSFETEYMLGDTDGDGEITISDVIYLIDYLFKGGTAPDPLYVGDTNCDGQVTVSDIVYLINYLFKGGPAPAC